jgi:hypothetical protein
MSSHFWRRCSRPATSWCSTTSPRTTVDGVRQAIAAAAAAILDPPPYSPDLNPLEQLFAATRTRDELWTTIGRLLATAPPGECANHLSHCGYGST